MVFTYIEEFPITLSLRNRRRARLDRMAASRRRDSLFRVACCCSRHARVDRTTMGEVRSSPAVRLISCAFLGNPRGISCAHGIAPVILFGTQPTTTDGTGSTT